VESILEKKLMETSQVMFGQFQETVTQNPEANQRNIGIGLQMLWFQEFRFVARIVQGTFDLSHLMENRATNIQVLIGIALVDLEVPV
jgi:hypothetical protein